MACFPLVVGLAYLRKKKSQSKSEGVGIASWILKTAKEPYGYASTHSALFSTKHPARFGFGVAWLE
jgi:hypothetical protein